MLHPLVSLWRHSCRVTFYESAAVLSSISKAGAVLHQGAGAGVPRRFRSQDEAMTYLRYWGGDPGAQADLRWIVQRLDAPMSGRRGGPIAWLDPLAALVVAGAILVVEESSSRARPGRLVAPPAAGGMAALDSLPALSSLPQIAAAPNLLPVLEDIQVEGAEVLPELDEAMARIDATLASMDTAGASLEPAPSRVAQIQAALQKANDESKRGLDQS